jgi:hypothetical protein
MQKNMSVAILADGTVYLMHHDSGFCVYTIVIGSYIGQSELSAANRH